MIKRQQARTRHPKMQEQRACGCRQRNKGATEIWEVYFCVSHSLFDIWSRNTDFQLKKETFYAALFGAAISKAHNFPNCKFIKSSGGGCWANNWQIWNARGGNQTQWCSPPSPTKKMSCFDQPKATICLAENTCAATGRNFLMLYKVQ